MLSMHHVYYSYHKHKKTSDVIIDMSADFEPGKVYAIYGPSGAGKTTCLSLLGGLEAPTSGSILLDGKNIKEIGYSNLRKHEVSYVFQDYHLFPYMTSIENVQLAASISSVPKQAQQEEIIPLLHLLGIDDATMHRKVSEISGGQQQRIALARALISKPTYLLADEPTGNLDADNAVHVTDLLIQLAHEQRKAVIIATHAEAIRNRADVRLEIVDGAFRQVDAV